jgi:hypothetical protein
VADLVSWRVIERGWSVVDAEGNEIAPVREEQQGRRGRGPFGGGRGGLMRILFGRRL